MGELSLLQHWQQFTQATRDASPEDFRQRIDGSGQKIEGWDERSEPNPEQRKGEENIMGILLTTIPYSLRGRTNGESQQG